MADECSSSSSIDTNTEIQMYTDLLKKRAEKSLQKHPNGLLGYDKTARERFVDSWKTNAASLKDLQSDGKANWRNILGPPLDDEERERLGYDREDSEDGNDEDSHSEDNNMENNNSGRDKPEIEYKKRKMKDLEDKIAALQKENDSMRVANKTLRKENSQFKIKLSDQRKPRKSTSTASKYTYRCPVCTYQGWNIKRHMKKHHPKQIHKLHMQKEEMKWKARHKHRWCSECSSYKARIHDHLQKKHQMNANSEAYRYALRQAHSEYMKRKCQSSSHSENKVKTSNTKTKKDGAKGKERDKNEEHVATEEELEDAAVEAEGDNVSEASDGIDDDANEKETTASEEREVYSKEIEVDESTEEAEEVDLEESMAAKEKNEITFSDEDEDDAGIDDNDYENAENQSEESDDYGQDKQVNWASEISKSDSTHIKIFKRFYKHLQHPDGGLKTARDSYQCTQRIYKMTQELSLDKLSFSWLLDHDNIWHNFVERQLRLKEEKPKEGLSAKTLKVYLLTLEKFLKFAFQRDIVKPNLKDDVESLRKKLPSWRHALKRESRKQEENKFERDVEEMPMKEDLAFLLTHDIAVKIKEYINNYNNENTCTLPEVITARDYLISRVFVETMCRSGVVANLTLDQVKKAKEMDVDGKKQYSICVTSHKTLIEKGATYPSLSAELYSLLCKFIEQCRPLLITDHEKDDNKRPVFVSATGEAFDSSSTGRRVAEFAKKVGIIRKFTPTLIRKTSSTIVASEDLKVQEGHAQLLEHNLTTEIRFYRRLNKEKIQSKASVENQERLGISSVIRATSDYTHQTTKTPEEHVEEEHNVKKVTFVPEESVSVHNGRPSKFSTKGDEEINERFGVYISKGIAPNLEEIRKIIKSSVSLSQFTEKEIRSRIHYLLKLTKPELPKDEVNSFEKTKQWVENADKMMSFSDTQSSTCIRRSSMRWDREDTDTIVRAFKEDLDKDHAPFKKRMLDVFQTTPDLQEIFTRYNDKAWEDRCLDKVRTEWKRIHNKMPEWKRT